MHIDRAGAQLLFVDLQAFLTTCSATESPGIIGKAAGALARTATALGMPITFSLALGAQKPPDSAHCGKYHIVCETQYLVST